MIVIRHYLSPDELAIAIRNAGGSAWTETEDGRTIVITRQSIAWVRKLCRRNKWIRP